MSSLSDVKVGDVLRCVWFGEYPVYMPVIHVVKGWIVTRSEARTEFFWRVDNGKMRNGDRYPGRPYAEPSEVKR